MGVFKAGRLTFSVATVFASGLFPLAALAQQPNGTFFIDNISNPTGLFPLVSNDAHTLDLIGYFFEELAERDPETYEWKPRIASSWEISKDGKQFTFTINPRAKFWDGSKVTPEDVKFSFDVINMPGVADPDLRPYYSAIEKAEVVSADKVRFTTRESYFKNFDVAAGLTIFQKKFYSAVYAKDKTMAKPESTRTAMGTGAWKLEKWDNNQRFILKRDPNYWDNETYTKENRYTFERLYFKIIPERTVAFETFKKGEITFFEFTPKQWALQSDGPEFKTKLTKVKTSNKAPVSYRHLAWNNKHPILSDKNVRWALSHLANIPLWTQKFDFGLSESAISPFGPKSDAHDPALKPVPFDLSAARKRLADAGWKTAGKDGFLVKDGRKFEITIMYPTQSKETVEPKLTEYKNQAAKVGVSILLKAVEWTSFTKLIDERNFDAVTLSWTRSVDPDAKQIWHTDSFKDQGSNFVGYSNPEVDKLIDEVRKTLPSERAKRMELNRKIEKLIYEDQPYTFLTEAKYVLYGHPNGVKKPKDTYNYSIGIQYWKVP